MEKVKEKDLIVVDTIAEGTVAVKPSCSSEEGHWYCATHLYHQNKDVATSVHNSDSSHFGKDTNHLLAWICDQHGAEVPY